MDQFENGVKYQCLLDSGTTHTILKHKEYFSELKMVKADVTTISKTTNLIEGYEKAKIILPNGTKLVINDALYSSKSRRNLISFQIIQLSE